RSEQQFPYFARLIRTKGLHLGTTVHICGRANQTIIDNSPSSSIIRKYDFGFVLVGAQILAQAGSHQEPEYLALGGNAVFKGMSGSPVFVPGTYEVIGVMSERVDIGTQGWIGVVPSELIKKLDSRIKLHEPTSLVKYLIIPIALLILVTFIIASYQI